MKAITKLRMRRILNGLIGLSIIVVFFVVDFLISAIPAILIKPTSMFEILVVFMLFLIIFIGILFLAVFIFSKRAEQILGKADFNE